MVITSSKKGQPESCMKLVNPLHPILKGILLGLALHLNDQKAKSLWKSSKGLSDGVLCGLSPCLHVRLSIKTQVRIPDKFQLAKLLLLKVKN
jgi:hypothetical protein